MGWNRREFVSMAVAMSAVVRAAAEEAAPGRGGQGVPPPLHRFIADYMAAMNAPGLTLALANRRGPVAAAFGFVDIAARIPVNPRHRFEIGSITKSFTAIVILQLQDEGKLEVEQPIRKYLPWLPIETDYGEILIHHLLTHSSGMPSDDEVQPADGGQVRQSFKPGTQFHYSNWGYTVLGLLIESIEAMTWGQAVSRRILGPLGMTDTTAIISSADRVRIAQSYAPLQDDRPYPRHGALAPAGILTFTRASGAIASTPADMARYMSMLLAAGVGPGGRLVSEGGFRAFSTAHIAAAEFGPGVSYGYGIAVDTLDGHRRLRHTGGMVSFMSAMHLDLDAGIGAFASINAQLGYRPNPVAQYAIQVLRAAQDRKPAPPAPPADEAAVVKNAPDYAGRYRAADGRVLEVAADNERLTLIADGEAIALQHVKGEQFIASHPRFALYALLFGRGVAPNGAPGEAVTEVAHGPDWFAHSRFTGAMNVPEAPELAPFAGTYSSNDPWLGTTRIVVRRGQLWANGVFPLVRIGDGLFRLADEPSSPETAEFRGIVNHQAQILVMGGGVSRWIPEAWAAH